MIVCLDLGILAWKQNCVQHFLPRCFSIANPDGFIVLPVDLICLCFTFETVGDGRMSAGVRGLAGEGLTFAEVAGGDESTGRRGCMVIKAASHAIQGRNQPSPPSRSVCLQATSSLTSKSSPFSFLFQDGRSVRWQGFSHGLHVFPDPKLRLRAASCLNAIV